MLTGFGRYQPIERLAVREGTDLFLVKVSGDHGFERYVVLKRLLDDSEIETFVEDAKLSAMLSHPKIVETLELGKAANVHYVAMEYVEGIDLAGLQRELAGAEQQAEPALAAWIAQEILDALEYAHQLADGRGQPLGIIHGRLSPSKVLLGASGAVKLCDFGSPRPFELELSLGATDYSYMSPEQVMEKPLDARTDVFAVGVILAELLIGRPLFGTDNPFDVLLRVRDVNLTNLDTFARGIDAGLIQIVRTALEGRVEKRWSSAAAFRDALGEWLFEGRHRVSNHHVAKIVTKTRSALSASSTIEPTSAREDASGPIELAPKSNADDLTAPARERLATGSVVKARLNTIEIPPLMRPDKARNATPRGGTPVFDAATQASSEASAEPHARSGSSSGGAGRSSRDLGVYSSLDGITPLQHPDAEPPQVVETDSERPPNPLSRTTEDRPRLSTRGSLHPQRVDRISTESVKRVVRRAEPPPSADSIGAALESLLPPRGPVAASEQPRQVLTPEEVAKAGQPALPTLAHPDQSPDDSGDFSETSPIGVLFGLIRSRATGLLAISIGDVRKDVHVRDGQLVGVRSNVAADLFGSYLVAKGILTDGELAMALAMVSHYGGKIGDTLVGLGLLKRIEVFRHLARHARARIIEICASSEGQYLWYAGADTGEAFPLEVEGFSILGEGAMALGDDLVKAWIAKHRDLRLVAAETRAVTPELFGVRGLVELLGVLGGASVGELVEAQATSGEQLHTGRILHLLVASRLARPIS